MHSIYVYGSTGNSLWIGRRIAALLEAAVGVRDVRLHSIPALMKQGSWSIEGDTVGFVFPCYYGSAPRIVGDFIQGSTQLSTRYSWGVVSAGGNTGLSLSSLDNTLKSVGGARLDYGRSVLLISNYMNGWYYSLIMPKPAKLEKRFRHAERVCQETARAILNRQAHRDKENVLGFHIPRFLSPARYVKDTRAWDGEFSTADACTGCGTCVRACPVGNIALNKGKPMFAHRCERCMACMQFCPNRALFIKGKPMDKFQYHHPQIDLKDLESFNR
jgi:ferredoxin